jgi:hypothetical protein
MLVHHSLLFADQLHLLSLFTKINHLAIEMAVTVCPTESLVTADEVPHLVVAQTHGRAVTEGASLVILHPDFLCSWDLVRDLCHYHLGYLFWIMRCNSIRLSHDDRRRINISILWLFIRIVPNLCSCGHLWLKEWILANQLNRFDLAVTTITRVSALLFHQAHTTVWTESDMGGDIILHH